MKITRSFTFLFLLALSLQLKAQNGPVSPANPVLKYGQTITPNDLKAHLYFLASPELEGRETGERGQRVAAQYIAAHFRRLGLKAPVIEKGAYTYFQHFQIRNTVFESAEISLGPKKKYSFGKDFYAPNPGDLPASLEGSLVFTGYGIEAEGYDNMKGLNVSDKIAVAFWGEPIDENGHSRITGKSDLSDWSASAKKKTELMQMKGAKALVLILNETEFTKLEGFSWNRIKGKNIVHLVNPLEEESIPVLLVNEKLGSELLKYGRMKFEEARTTLNQFALVTEYDFRKIHFQMKAETSRNVKESENVCGYLEGTDKKEELLVITAHFDHLGIHDGQTYFGADDDGSGTSAVLELAEAFAEAAKNGNRPRRSILFMPVAGEEKGLLGSSFYSTQPVFPLKNTVADLNIDMIGRVDESHEKNSDSLYVYIIGSDKLSTDLHQVNDSMNKTFTRLNLDYTYNQPDDPNRFYYRSDHYNFAKNNIPVIFYFTGVHADYHKPTDTADKIQFVKMTEIVKLVFATAWEIANRDERLKVDKVNDFPSNR